MPRAVTFAMVLVGLLFGSPAKGQGANQPVQQVEQFVLRHWKLPLALQGEVPKGYSPLEASLDPESCGVCHPVQHQDWKTSLHAKAMGPGIVGQLVDMFRASPADALNCTTCHAPLAEQQPVRIPPSGAAGKNPAFAEGLDKKGLVCAACHVRNHQRFGPPKAGEPLGPSPEKAPHGGVTRTVAFERSEFCRECHQHPPSAAINGKPIENTYVEWKEGPYSKMGVQCQDCHMPGRRHLWRGIHDKEMTARAVALGVQVARGKKAAPGRVVAKIELTNTGAGHMFPTYMIPAVFLKAELQDKDGKAVEGSLRTDRIQRLLEFTNQGWVERADTRIAPQKTHIFHYNVPNPRGAKRLRVYVEVHPDDFYGRSFFPSFLQGQLSAEARKLIEKARGHAMSTPYILYDRTLLLP
ncbi:MAG: multiheme c-type cytochrome [Nitrospinota bacterium]